MPLANGRILVAATAALLLSACNDTGSTGPEPIAPRVGARITDAGEVPLPEVVERERHLGDVSVRFPIGARVTGRVDAKNLLDAPHHLVQGPITRERYRMGLSWRR